MVSFREFNSKFPTSIPTSFICGVPPGTLLPQHYSTNCGMESVSQASLYHVICCNLSRGKLTNYRAIIFLFISRFILSRDNLSKKKKIVMCLTGHRSYYSLPFQRFCENSIQASNSQAYSPSPFQRFYGNSLQASQLITVIPRQVQSEACYSPS